MSRFVSRFAAITAAVFVAGSVSALAQSAKSDEYVPEKLQDVGVDEHLDAPIPLDAQFVDENGKDVTLGDYFTGDRPVILTLNYYSCPMLCTLELNGMVDALKDIDLKPAKQYEIVTLSFNPREGPALAKLKKQNYVKDFGVAGAGQGWHFLTGKEDEIKKLTDAIGFKYKWDEANQQYSHPAVMAIITPDGNISRYLYGVLFQPKDMRFALLEASKGKIGNTVDRILLYCYCYDPDSGTYSPVATKVMSLGGGVVLLVLVLVLVPLWVKEFRRSKAESHEETPQ